MIYGDVAQYIDRSKYWGMILLDAMLMSGTHLTLTCTYVCTCTYMFRAFTRITMLWRAFKQLHVHVRSYTVFVICCASKLHVRQWSFDAQ